MKIRETYSQYAARIRENREIKRLQSENAALRDENAKLKRPSERPLTEKEKRKIAELRQKLNKYNRALSAICSGEKPSNCEIR